LHAKVWHFNVEEGLRFRRKPGRRSGTAEHGPPAAEDGRNPRGFRRAGPKGEITEAVTGAWGVKNRQDRRILGGFQEGELRSVPLARS
jgi:hypothetical protein